MRISPIRYTYRNQPTVQKKSDSRPHQKNVSFEGGFFKFKNKNLKNMATYGLIISVINPGMGIGIALASYAKDKYDEMKNDDTKNKK